jgi:uncharacterized protein (TIGR00730 family)
MKYIAVFCGSSNPAAPKYKEIAEEIITQLVGAGFGIVYGGTTGGLMKVVANKVLELEGDIVGIVTRNHRPDADLPKKKVITTPNVSIRKDSMISLACGAIILPGGMGTMDELFTLMKYNDEVHRVQDEKTSPLPTVIVNADGFFDGLIQQIGRCYQENLFSHIPLKYTKVTSNVVEVISHVKEFIPQPMTLWLAGINHVIIATTILNDLDRDKTAANYEEFLEKITVCSRETHAKFDVNGADIQRFIAESCNLSRPKRKDTLFPGKPQLTFDETKFSRHFERSLSPALN